jgi:hypothetical protein
MRALSPRTSCFWKTLRSTSAHQQRRLTVTVIVGALRSFSSTAPARQSSSTMEVELTAPNGRKWTQPLGLFINNVFVKSSNGQTIASINPTCVHQLQSHST